MFMKKKIYQPHESLESEIRAQKLKLIQTISMIFLSLSIIILLLMR